MRQPPSGTVTLLFTDVEGSTRLIDALGADRYAELLAVHGRLVREAVAARGGFEVDTAGDSFFVAFPSAREAVAAAASVQRALAVYNWPDGVGVRVRMGLHTGEPLVAGAGYVGLDVHRAARLMAAGHGGQVLLSQATRDLVHQDLPDTLSLRDLGEHRLKDLTLPQRLYQLCGADLVVDFPPPKTLENRPTNLPAQPTALVGRERELAELQALLAREDVRLLTLTGPGGTGKTRLALQLAAEAVESFPDGVWFVNLAALTDPAQVMSALAQTLGATEDAARPLVDTVAEQLATKRSLVLLDNFEHLLEAAPGLSSLLPPAPELKLVATSRTPLRLAAEQEYPVPPLAGEEALALFTARARAAKPSFALDGNRPLVAEICRRLDHLPLAIELAAARIKLLPEKALLERLDHKLKLLTGGARDLPERQQTLRAAIEWSYGLLTPEEQTLTRRLAVFAGGRSLEAIEAICSADGELEALDLLASLVDKSLLRQEQTEDGEPRFVMLETIHDYARERLQASGEADALHRRHAEFFVEFAERAAEELSGDEQAMAGRRFEAERDNVRAALAWALNAREEEMTLLLAHAFGRLCFTRGPIGEGRRWLDAALKAGAAPTRSRLKALYTAAYLAYMENEHETAQALAEEGLTLARDLDDPESAARALMVLGFVAVSRGNHERGDAALEEAAELYTRIGDDRHATRMLHMLGYNALEQRDFPRARALIEDALARSRRAGDIQGISAGAGNLGAVLREEGRTAEALPFFREALVLAHDLGHGPWILSSLYEIAVAVAPEGRHEEAAVLLGGAEALRESHGLVLERTASDGRLHEEALGVLRSELDADTLARSWERGRGMTTDDLVACAVDSIDSVLGDAASDSARSLA